MGGAFDEAHGYGAGGEDVPRFNFDYFAPAMITSFLLLTTTWYDAAVAGLSVGGPSVLAFYVFVVLIGAYLIMNLFIAILLEAFAAPDEDDSEGAEAASDGAATEPAAVAPGPPCAAAAAAGDGGAASGHANGTGGATLHDFKTVGVVDEDGDGVPDDIEDDAGGDWAAGGVPRGGKPPSPLRMRVEGVVRDDESTGGGSDGPDGPDEQDCAGELGGANGLEGSDGLEDFDDVEDDDGRARTASVEAAREAALIARHAAEWSQAGVSLGCLGGDSALRKGASQLVFSPAFENFIVGVIVVSSVCLAMDSPRLPADSALAAVLGYLDVLWTVVFLFECALKVVALGFVCNGRHSYLRDAWNVLDFAIVCVSVLLLLGIPQFKPLRILRVLRPLRLVSRSQGMRLIVSSLIKALPAVANAFGVVLAFMLVFAILGMQLFMDSFGACTDPTFRTREACLSLPPAAPPMPNWAPPQLSPPAAAALLSPPTPKWAPPPTPPSFRASPLPILPSGLPPGPLREAAGVEANGEEDVGSGLDGRWEQLFERLPHESSAVATTYSLVDDTPASEIRVPAFAGSSPPRQRRLKGGGSSIGVVGAQRRWVNPNFGSFDDFGSAMVLVRASPRSARPVALMHAVLSPPSLPPVEPMAPRQCQCPAAAAQLFVLSTKDGWEEAMFAGMDAVGPGVAGVRDDSSPAALFFVLWIFFGSFFAMNLFVGVIVENFNKISKRVWAHSNRPPAPHPALLPEPSQRSRERNAAFCPVLTSSALVARQGRKRYGDDDGRAAAVGCEHEGHHAHPADEACAATALEPPATGGVQAHHCRSNRDAAKRRHPRQCHRDGVRLLGNRTDAV